MQRIFLPLHIINQRAALSVYIDNIIFQGFFTVIIIAYQKRSLIIPDFLPLLTVIFCITALAIRLPLAS